MCITGGHASVLHQRVCVRASRALCSTSLAIARCILFLCSDKIGDDPGEMESLRPINFGRGLTVKTISSGGRSICAVLSDNRVRCFDIEEALETAGDPLQPSIFGSGADSGVPTRCEAQVKTIAVGPDYRCVVLLNGQTRCFGDNSEGQLGAGSSAFYIDMNDMNWADPTPPIDFGPGKTVKAISAGSSHTCGPLIGVGSCCSGCATACPEPALRLPNTHPHAPHCVRSLPVVGGTRCSHSQ